MQTIKLKVDELDLEEVKKENKKNKNKKEEPLFSPIEEKLKKRSLARRIFFTFLVIFLGLIAALGIYAYFAVYAPYSRIKNDISDFQKIFSDFKDDLDHKDASKLDQRVVDAKAKLSDIETEVSSLSSFKSLPIASGYLDNANKGIKIANDAMNIVDKALPATKETLSAMGYKTQGAAENKNLNNDQQVEAFVQQVPKIADIYRLVEPDVLNLLDEVGQLNPDFLPKSDKYDIKKIITQLKDGKSDIQVLSNKIKETLDVLPELMGINGTAKYLIVFQNENELRASGGLYTAYGYMNIDKGKIDDKIEAEDTWYLEYYPKIKPVGLVNPPGQLYWMEKGCGGTTMRVQDSGVYPDALVNFKTFDKYYDAVPKKVFPAYDAAIMLSTDFASDLVSIVEPIPMPEYNEVITSKNLAERMSAQTELANKKYPIGSKDRKKFVKDLATALKDKITKSGVEMLPKVIKSILTGFQQKHIFLYSHNIDLQSYFDKWGVTGALNRDFNGDYLNISEAQNCSLKANLYTQDTVTQTIDIKDDGTIRKTIKIDWVNDKVPQKGQENIFNIDFPYRAWLRLFVPNGSTFVSSKNGIYPKSELYHDKVLDKDAIENLFSFRWRASEKAPPAKYSMENVYRLKEKFNSEQGYNLLLQKHPGKAAEPYDITLKYKGNEYRINITLERDKVIHFKDGKLTVENYDQRLDPIVNLFS